MGTLSISNPVWSLFGQKHRVLATFRSLSTKIKRDGRALFQVSSTASAQTTSMKLLFYYFLTFAVVLPHGRRFQAVKKVVCSGWRVSVM